MLTNPSGFVGVDGAFRFTATGTSQRALAVYQIQRGQTVVISPPPTTFSRRVLRRVYRRPAAIAVNSGIAAK